MTEPVIRQHWNEGLEVPVRYATDALFSRPPKTGVVIGTFAAVPYIHLQLEARRRFYPQVPLLVHDDGSNKSGELRALCDKYDCDFESNTTRQPPRVGDLTTFVGGLWWAQHRGLDVLLKVSRRWVFLVDWQPSLAALALHPFPLTSFQRCNSCTRTRGRVSFAPGTSIPRESPAARKTRPGIEG